MNERIKQVADEAGVKYSLWVGSKPAAYMTYDELEKFAELTIQKCISQIALIGVSNFENPDIMWTVETAISSIEKHFGVEE